MAKFRVLASMHEAQDRSAKPFQIKDPATGKVISERYPVRRFKVGEIVETDVDLVAKYGKEKFELVSGTPKEEPANPDNTAVAPGGQVSSGFQQTSGGVSGPMTAADAQASAERHKDDEPTSKAAEHPHAQAKAPDHAQHKHGRR